MSAFVSPSFPLNFFYSHNLYGYQHHLTLAPLNWDWLKDFYCLAIYAYLPVQVSPAGIISRDEKVFRFSKERNIPLVMLTSGPRTSNFKSFGIQSK